VLITHTNTLAGHSEHAHSRLKSNIACAIQLGVGMHTRCLWETFCAQCAHHIVRGPVTDVDMDGIQCRATIPCSCSRLPGSGEVLQYHSECTACRQTIVLIHKRFTCGTSATASPAKITARAMTGGAVAVVVCRVAMWLLRGEI